MGNTQNSGDGDPEAERGVGQHTRFFASLKGIAATLLTTGRTRLELLGNELEEEKLRAIRQLLMAQAMVFCFGVGVLLLVALLAVLFWDSKVLVIGGCATLFILLGGFFFRALLGTTQRSKPAFASSLAELEEDLRQLKAAARNEPATH